MHDEIIDEVHQRTGVPRFIIDAVTDSIFTGVQHATQHPEYIGCGIDLGPLLRVDIHYYYTVVMLHRLLLDHDIWFNYHPADNYTVVDKWAMIRNWEERNDNKYRQWRERWAELLDVDYSLISEEYDEYLMKKRKAHCRAIARKQAQKNK